MTPSFMTATRGRLAATALVSLGLCACIPPFSTAVKMFDEDYNKLVAQREKLEVSHAELREDYDNVIEKANAKAESSKKTIDAALKNGELIKALSAMKDMSDTLHADKNGTRMQRVVRHAGIGQHDYLEDAAKRSLKLTDEVLKQKRFKVVEQALTMANTIKEADRRTKKKIKKRQSQLYTQWLDHLKSSSAQVKKTHPGSALVYALKGRSIAQEVDNTQGAKELDAMVKSITKDLVRDKGFFYTFGRISGTHASETAKASASSSWSSHIYYARSKDARTDNVIALTLGEPDYRTSTGSDKGSFKYVSGQRTVRNPAYGRVESDLSYAKSILEDRERYANRISSGDSAYDAAQREYSEARSKVSSLESKLGSTPTEIQEDVYSNYSYPIKLHILKSSMAFSASSASMKGLDDVKVNKALSGQLVDKSHDAHSKGNGSVAANSANPPSRASGLKQLKQKASSTLSGVIVESMKVHQQSLLQGYDNASSKEDKINKLAIYAFISPKHADKAKVKELEELAQVSDIAALLETTKLK